MKICIVYIREAVVEKIVKFINNDAESQKKVFVLKLVGGKRCTYSYTMKKEVEIENKIKILGTMNG